jgi:hypothetical protein
MQASLSRLSSTLTCTLRAPCVCPCWTKRRTGDRLLPLSRCVTVDTVPHHLNNALVLQIVMIVGAFNRFYWVFKNCSMNPMSRTPLRLRLIQSIGKIVTVRRNVITHQMRSLFVVINFCNQLFFVCDYSQNKAEYEKRVREQALKFRDATVS